MSLKIVFMGTPEFSVPALDILFKKKFNVLSAYTQPPKKSKRGQKVNSSAVEEFCKKNKINFKNPSNLNSEEEFNNFKKLTDFCFNFMPSSIEIIEPETNKLSSGSIEEMLNDVLAKLHQYDMALKRMIMETRAKEQQAKKTEEEEK